MKSEGRTKQKNSAAGLPRRGANRNRKSSAVLAEDSQRNKSGGEDHRLFLSAISERVFLPYKYQTCSASAELSPSHPRSAPSLQFPAQIPEFQHLRLPEPDSSTSDPVKSFIPSALRSPDQFLENNSIADFMRFRRVIDDGGQGELQTAVVRYQKRFPWSLLHPFLQVDLVSTIHIADKE
ncbi:hypothetical protein ACLOJK_040283 [Asimina triloba]